MNWSDLISIVLAVVFGAAIGLEREKSRKAAGLRTNVLICLGAAVFTIMSREMAGGINASPARIAAQIVTGVGFLGAGAIIRDRGGVYGLTTAATIWLVASIGMSCGAGAYLLAFLVTIITVAVLFGLGGLEQTIKRISAKNEPKNNEEQKD